MNGLLKDLGRKSSKPLAIFLGAGASKTFGYPLTRDLMLDIFTGLRSGSLLKGLNSPLSNGKSKPARGRLWDFLNDLLPGKRMDRGQVPMVTGVLSLLDFSLSTGLALSPEWRIEEMREMRLLLESALLEVIPDDEDWQEHETEQAEAFEGMKRFLTRMMRQTGRQVALITTNYDMLTDLLAMQATRVAGTIGDWNFESVAKRVDFGFRWVHPEKSAELVFPRPENPAIALYKLHGSTNWLRCPLCENIYINPNGPISLIAGANDEDWDNSCHCETQLEAQIVSPSFVREMRAPNLAAVWKSSLDFLREADHWLIIGYSFPDEDVGIRALMTRAYGAQKKAPPKVSVVQLDDKARENYASFFPPDNMNYYTGGLGMLLDRAKSQR